LGTPTPLHFQLRVNQIAARKITALKTQTLVPYVADALQGLGLSFQKEESAFQIS
jgi:hypothetical protein